MRSQDSKAWKNAIDHFKEFELSAQGILVNSVEELEMLNVKGYEKVVKKVWCIGPLSLHDNKASIYDDESECVNFLISKKPCSVIYVCFGSMSRLMASQLKELALGLVKPSIHLGDWKKKIVLELEKWLVVVKYEERNKEKGVIIRGWAPQVKILSHPVTGSLLTHCGWNSTLKAVAAGVLMITWPMFPEQFYNEKLIVQVGVRVGIEVVVTMEAEKVLVKKEIVKNAIKNIVEQGVEGEKRRNRARELKEMASKAVEEGGSSTTNCKLFIHQIRGLIHN